jgi:hypothetical protein
MALETPSGEPSRRTLTVRSRSKSSRLDGRALLVGVAIVEGPLTTSVPSGENAGATLVEHHVVRRLLADSLTLRRDAPAEATFPLELGEGWNPARCDVVAFLQEEATGAIHQVATIPWDDRPAVER